jgi:hypothetical protein
MFYFSGSIIRKSFFMIRVLGVVFIFSVLALVSCQKEIDWGLGGAADSLLVRVFQKTGPDSITINYSYDASRRLKEEKITGTSQGIDAGNDLVINRNSSGIISNTVQKSAALVSAGIDSVVTRYHYDVAAGQYTSSVFDITLFGFTASDSAVFVYDASGKITRVEHSQSLAGMPYSLLLKQEYTYSAGGNIATMKQFSYDTTSGMYSLVSTLTYTYDSKINPLKINTEAIVLTRSAFFGPNNATMTQFDDATTPANNFSDTIVYVYNAGNKPQTTSDTRTPSGTVSNISFYYQ